MRYPRAKQILCSWPAWLLLWLVAGCSTGKDRSLGAASIDGLVLLSAPAAVDVEPTPGPDGIAVKVYATSQTKAKALAITSGQLEVILFDGVMNEETPPDVKPLRVWSRSAVELKPFANATAIGVSYPITLLWGDARPKQRMITVVARYLGPDGRVIYSGPSTIPVGGKAP